LGKVGAAPTGRDPAAALSPADPQEPPTHASRSAFVASRGSRPASDGRTVRHGRALFLLAQLRRDRALHVRRFVGGLLVGAGAFQLFDGLVHSKDVLTGWYPRTKLEMEPELRSRKRGKFGAVKYVYPPDEMRVLRAWFAEELERRLPAARLLYWT
jgi:hypothetical protein